MFTAKASEQIRKLLQFVAASGSAALVNTRSGAIVATNGTNDSIGLIADLQALDLRHDSVEDVPQITVGLVGNSHLLVVKPDIRVECTELRARIEKACGMLESIVGKATERSASQFQPWMVKD